MNDPKYPQVGQVHSRAIWNEIGERLRSTPLGRPSPISPNLLRLIGELHDLDVGNAPFKLN